MKCRLRSNKALFFKTIAVREKDIRSDYRAFPAPDPGAGGETDEKRNQYTLGEALVQHFR
jgi:hypothetical protein